MYSTFGTFGLVVFSTSEGSEQLTSVSLQPDGKISVDISRGGQIIVSKEPHQGQQLGLIEQCKFNPYQLIIDFWKGRKPVF